MEEKDTSKGLLCFGGSFNPIHYGHLQCCHNIAKITGYGKFCLIPSAQPPHKSRQIDIASATERLEMCRLATAGDPLFSINDLELHRDGPSYTIDTVRALKAQGHTFIQWLIGADMLQILPKWHQAENLIEEATILVMARPGFPFAWENLPVSFRHLKNNLVEAPLIDISATEIRRRVRVGLPLTDLTPPAVIEYIRQRGLYR